MELTKNEIDIITGSAWETWPRDRQENLAKMLRRLAPEHDILKRINRQVKRMGRAA